MKKKVLCVAYGSHLMGMGHLYRCRLILGALKATAKFEVTLLTRNFSESTEILKTLDVDQMINLPATENEDAVITYLADQTQRFDYCIVDELNSSLAKMQALKKCAQKVLSFDDKGEGASLADVLINVLYPNTPPYRNEQNSYEYLLIKDNSETKARYSFRKEVKNILINQGAADTWGAIPDFVKDLENTQNSYTVTLLLGPAFQHFKELDLALQGKKKHHYNVIPKTTQMSELLFQSDLAVLGGGNTVFEALSLGIPVITSTREEKELLTIDRLKSAGLVVGESQLYNGTGLAPMLEALAADVTQREQLYSLGRKCFNYDGLDNILKVLLEK